jgi:hypothetical protein
MISESVFHVWQLGCAMHELTLDEPWIYDSKVPEKNDELNHKSSAKATSGKGPFKPAESVPISLVNQVNFCGFYRSSSDNQPSNEIPN